MMSFSNFFHNHMVHKDQNEISPSIYYGISSKTNEKDLKIPNLQLPDWKQKTSLLNDTVKHVIYYSEGQNLYP